jgi:hypothetical protein
MRSKASYWRKQAPLSRIGQAVCFCVEAELDVTHESCMLDNLYEYPALYDRPARAVSKFLLRTGSLSRWAGA